MILRKIRTEPAVPDCSVGCTAPILSNTVMAVVQDSNLISFSSTQLTTFQTVSFYLIIYIITYIAELWQYLIVNFL